MIALLANEIMSCLRFLVARPEILLPGNGWSSYNYGTEGAMHIFLFFASLLYTLVVKAGPAFVVSNGLFSTARDKVAPYH